MSQFSGSSNIEQMMQNIIQNGLVTTNRYVVEFGFCKALTQASILTNPSMNIFPDTKNLMLRCTAAALPGQDIASQSYKIYGPLRQMPYEAIYSGQLSLTYILSQDMRERAFFERWMDFIINKTNYKIAFYDEYTTTMSISVLNRNDEVMYRSHVQEVYPKTLGEIALATDKENEYMTQEITFAFRKYTSEYFTVQAPKPSATPSQPTNSENNQVSNPPVQQQFQKVNGKLVKVGSDGSVNGVIGGNV